MSRKDEEQSKCASKAGQNRPKMSLFLMLMSGILLIALLSIPPLFIHADGQWWLPAASDRGKMFALVLAGMVLADNLLKNHDPASFVQEFSTIVIALMAWWAVFYTTFNDADGSLGSFIFTLLALIPVLVAVAGPRVPWLK